MKKWFEYQLINQRDPNYVLGSATAAKTNVLQHMRLVFDYVKAIYNQPRVTRRAMTAFDHDSGYVDCLRSNVPDIDPAVLESWIYDDDYRDLLNRPNYELVEFNDPSDINLILTEFCRAMEIGNGIDQAKPHGAVKMHVQHPGQMFPLHLDRPQHNDFQVNVSSLQQTPSHQRYLIFIEDQKPGQLFQMDYDLLHWRAGDVFTWNARNTMHGSANVGYWSRFMLMITLKNQTV